jgi:hypothetical protein
MVHFSFCIFYNINWTDLPLKCWTRMIIVLNCYADLLWLRIVLNCYAELLWINLRTIQEIDWKWFANEHQPWTSLNDRVTVMEEHQYLLILHLIAKLSD